MAEETEHAAVNIPRAILCSMLINGMVGFVMMLTILFCLGDVESVLNTDTGYPFLQIFYSTSTLLLSSFVRADSRLDSVNSRAGATAMGAIVLALTWACATGIITTASRMTWSFARDNGTPFSRIVKVVSKRRQIPIMAVFVVTTLAALLILIYIGSSTAFNDVISLTITGFYCSYFLPAAFLLHHRLKGKIAPYQQDTPGVEVDSGDHDPVRKPSGHHASPKVGSASEGEPAKIKPASLPQRRRSSVVEPRLAWGPFHVPGLLGTINNAYACIYMIFVIFWSVWPPATPVSADTMNYSIVVTSGVIILSIIWYYVRGREEYTGPLIDDEIAALMGISPDAPA